MLAKAHDAARPGLVAAVGAEAGAVGAFGQGARAAVRVLPVRADGFPVARADGFRAAAPGRFASAVSPVVPAAVVGPDARFVRRCRGRVRGPPSVSVAVSRAAPSRPFPPGLDRPAHPGARGRGKFRPDRGSEDILKARVEGGAVSEREPSRGARNPESRGACLVRRRGETPRAAEGEALPPVGAAEREPAVIPPHVPASPVEASGGVDARVRGAVPVHIHARGEPDARVVSVYLEGHVLPGPGARGLGHGFYHAAGGVPERRLVVAFLPLVPGVLGVLGAEFRFFT